MHSWGWPNARLLKKPFRQDYCFLGLDAVQFDSQAPTFQRNVLRSDSTLQMQAAGSSKKSVSMN
jgi:hypothetical protein